MNKKELEDKIYNYPTIHKEGFLDAELKELLKDYPTINMNKYYDALMGITCMSKGGEGIVYHCDVYHAILCGIENRNLKIYEWD